MALAILFILGLVVFIFLNLLVIAVLVHSRKVNYIGALMISLAVSDLLQAGIGYSVELHSYYTSKPISDFSCQFAAFFVTFLSLVSISHLTGIAVGRYIVLRYPIKMRTWLQQPMISFYIIIPSWMYGFLWAIFPLLGWSRYTRQPGMKHTCSIDLTSTGWKYTSYTYNLLFWCFLLPIGVIIYCSYSIYGSLKTQRSRSMVHSLPSGSKVTDLRKKLERQHSIMSLVMIGMFLFVWSPYACCVLVLTVHGSVPGYLLTAAVLFAKSSSLYNPFIYFMFLEEFRIKIRTFFIFTWKSLRYGVGCKDSPLNQHARVSRSKSQVLVLSVMEQSATDARLRPTVNTVVFFTRHNSYIVSVGRVR